MTIMIIIKYLKCANFFVTHNISAIKSTLFTFLSSTSREEFSDGTDDDVCVSAAEEIAPR